MSTAMLDTEAVDVPEEYEFVRGKLVEVLPMSFYAGEIANRLMEAMLEHPGTRSLGRLRIESYFRVPTPADSTKIRRPDLAFVAFETLPRDRPIPLSGNAIDVVPELVVEIQSPTDLARDLMSKMRQYLAAGVKGVWLIYPDIQEIHCYEGLLPPRTYRLQDTLDGGAALPGFQIKVDALFPPVLPGSNPHAEG